MAGAYFPRHGRICTALGALTLLLGAAAAEPETVSLLALYRDAIGAREAQDRPRFSALAERALALAPENPGIVYLAAQADAIDGRGESAATRLTQLGDRGFAYEFWARPEFSRFLADPRVVAARSAMRQNAEPRGKLRPGIALSPGTIDPEGVDAYKNGWVVGSMADGSVHAVAQDGAARPLWRETRPRRRTLGVRFDRKAVVVWACSGGVDEQRSESELIRIDAVGTATHHPLPSPRSLCNDIALIADGAAVVTDSELGALWRLDAGGKWHALAAPGSFEYPNGVAYADKTGVLFVSDLRGLWSIRVGGRPERVENSGFLGGIDGLVWTGKALIGVQNGVRPERVVHIALDAAGARVTNITVAASGAPELAEMTTGALGAGGYVVIAAAPGQSSATPIRNRLVRVPLR